MEKEFAKIVVGKLSNYFDIKDEVWSKCGRYRIDFVITEKINGSCFGIEFKDFDRKRGEGIGEHILQSIRYSLSEFKTNEGFKRIPIFICPPISSNYLVLSEIKKMIDGKENHIDRHEKNHEHHTVNGLLGSLNIGEIRTTEKRNKQVLYFAFSNRIIWSNEVKWNSNDIRGLHTTNYELLIKKINSFAI